MAPVDCNSGRILLKVRVGIRVLITRYFFLSLVLFLITQEFQYLVLECKGPSY